MWIILVVLSSFGLNLTVWAAIASARFIAERRITPFADGFLRVDSRRRWPGGRGPVGRSDVAVLIPAHNEATVISATLRAIRQLVGPDQVFVVSDGSSDRTAELARAEGVEVHEIPVAGGKAQALHTGIEVFGLRDRFGAVLLLDADTRLSDDYFAVALPLFDDPAVAAVAGCASTVWRPHESTFLGEVLAAHRERTYLILQRVMRYGQCWRPIDVSPIVPGFASLYRTAVLGAIRIDAPGLVIEDFNMTFEVHHRGLGRVAFEPGAVAYTEDPHRLSDYYRQVSRWALGFWQTIRAHGVWRSRFWFALGLLLAEMIAGAVALLALVGALIVSASVTALHAILPAGGPTGALSDVVSHWVSAPALLLALVVPDYLMTVAAAWYQRRPRYLLLGLCFLPLRVLDAFVSLRALPRAWSTGSTGRWESPQRLTAAPTPTPARELSPR